MNPNILFLIQEYLDKHTGFLVEDTSEELHQLIQNVLEENAAMVFDKE